MAFWGLTDLAQFAGIKTTPQGVSHPTDGEIWGRRVDNTINRTTG